MKKVVAYSPEITVITSQTSASKTLVQIKTQKQGVAGDFVPEHNLSTLFSVVSGVNMDYQSHYALSACTYQCHPLARTV